MTAPDPPADLRRRALTLTDDLLHAYSRRGNFHSDPEAASSLGYAGLVAQGMQVAGPAFGILLDAWGEDFLAHGEIELTFVGLVHGGDTVAAEVDLTHSDVAEISVTIADDGPTVVVGRARRRA